MSYGNGITVTSGFDLGARSPLDSRTVVSTVAERDAHITGNRAYIGMKVFVTDTKKTYALVDANTWEEDGFDQGRFDEGVKSIIEKNTAQDKRLTTLEETVSGGENGGLAFTILEDVIFED